MLDRINDALSQATQQDAACESVHGITLDDIRFLAQWTEHFRTQCEDLKGSSDNFTSSETVQDSPQDDSAILMHLQRQADLEGQV